MSSLSLSHTGGIQLPSNSSIYGRSPLPGTVYYNQFNCSHDANSLDQCDPQFAGEHCYTGELDFIVQCDLPIGMFIILIHILNNFFLHINLYASIGLSP